MSDSISPTVDQTEKVKLDINDINRLLAIIDLASQRGAFRASELSQIGSIFDRVNAWLNVVSESTSNEGRL